MELLNSDQCRVFICGAHSTGKTTLVREIVRHVKIHAQTEVARDVLREQGWSREDIDPSKNPQAFQKLQSLILKKQCDVERDLAARGLDYICDRGIVPLVYAAKYGGQEAVRQLITEASAQECINRYKNSMIFVLTPHKECLFDDDVRLNPILDDLEDFTDHMTRILQELNINYTLISMLDLQERIKVKATT